LIFSWDPCLKNRML